MNTGLAYIKETRTSESSLHSILSPRSPGSLEHIRLLAPRPLNRHPKDLKLHHHRQSVGGVSGNLKTQNRQRLTQTSSSNTRFLWPVEGPRVRPCFESTASSLCVRTLSWDFFFSFFIKDLFSWPQFVEWKCIYYFCYTVLFGWSCFHRSHICSRPN